MKKYKVTPGSSYNGHNAGGEFFSNYTRQIKTELEKGTIVEVDDKAAGIDLAEANKQLSDTQDSLKKANEDNKKLSGDINAKDKTIVDLQKQLSDTQDSLKKANEALKASKESGKDPSKDSVKDPKK